MIETKIKNMEEKKYTHYSVLLNEAVDALKPDGSSEVFIDATMGGAGHSELIAKRISKNGRLICFDVDADAIKEGRKKLSAYKNVTVIHDSYANLKYHLEKLGIEKITGGILFDLGASMHQFQTAERGFSFMKDAPLDMRFDMNAELAAADIINNYREDELVKIFSEYGEERFSKRIARAVIANRPIYTTLQLVDVIKKSTPKINSKIHCATRVFQALRIEVNKELLNFENTLNEVVTLLHVGAIISVISFHSLEDRIAKQVLKSFSNSCRCPRSMPVCECEGKMLELVNKKPIEASASEIAENPASRSAKLRIARRI